MVVEIAICSTALILTAVLFLFAVRCYRVHRSGRFIILLVGIAIAHLLAFRLAGPQMRGYVYRSVDPEETFYECPFKGISYESMLAKHRIAGSPSPLFRTFGRDWWNFYRWYDYATHPRWKLPSLPDWICRAEPVKSRSRVLKERGKLLHQRTGFRAYAIRIDRLVDLPPPQMEIG
jgi:hypothetical protein